jgi:hypothetical protein
LIQLEIQFRMQLRHHHSQRILQAHLKTAQATAHTKVFKRAYKADPKEKLFLKNFNASKKIKNATHSRHDNDTETQY